MARWIEIEGLGRVLVERSARARRMNITVRPFRGVRVAVPRGVPFEEAAAFARRKRDWIAAQLEKARRSEAQHRAFERECGLRLNPRAARDKLVARLEELARRHGFVYNRVFVRRQKTRWGSCSARHNISLNINIVRLPPELRDYILLHELMHTRFLNHSRRFWTELEKIAGDVKALNARMKRYSAMLL